MHTPQSTPADPTVTTPRGLEDDAEGARIVRDELRLLASVLDALDAAAGADVSAARARISDDARMLELRDDVSVAKPEDLPSLFEQMHHVAALRGQRGRSVSGSVDRATPYFGHMLLEEAVPPRELRPGMPPVRKRDVFIGSRSYVDSGAGIRIVDWRQAPVSRFYYRYVEGEDYEEQLGDRIIEGTMVIRRGVSIVRGELIRVSSPQGTYLRGRDGVWKSVGVQVARLETEKHWSARHGVAHGARLGVGMDGNLRQDKHLPAIASMLDEAQFALISRDTGGLVAIQGSAGSGKTTVGLHRIAYLAFAEPQRFRPEKMLVVVPNEALIHYVSRVLPSLQVEGVPVSTFTRYATRLVLQTFPKLPARVTDDTPPVVARVKSHPAMLGAIERLVANIERTVDERLRAGVQKWPEGATVLAAWEASKGEGGESSAPDVRLSILSNWMAGKRQLPDLPRGDRLPQVTLDAMTQLGTQLRQMTRGVLGLWDELLTSRESLAQAFDGLPGFGASQLDQAHMWCVRQSRLRAEGERDGEDPHIDEEDRALLLRCWQVLRGPLVDGEGKPIRLTHIFVDEVQDASPIELRVLLDLVGREKCITLAGDVAQRMLDEGDDRGEFDWTSLLSGLGMAYAKIEPLKVSYRSTAEITDFARAVLGPLAHDDVPATTRRGPPVEHFGFSTPGETVAWLSEALKQLARDEPTANVALVARFAQQAEVYFEGLERAEVPNVRRVAKQDFGWDAGVDVTDVRQTKGLEFDEVVLLETTAASYPVSPQARHAMYVGATRASHQLWCVSSDEPSKLVTDAIGEAPVNP